MSKARKISAARRVRSAPKCNGAIIYSGPSALDGMPIVVILVGLKDSSANRKTGAMLQTYILRADLHPVTAVKTGADASICGDCAERGNGDGSGRTCYVELAKGPTSVFNAYRRGVYPMAPDAQAIEALAALRIVRLGTYGDPAAVPVWVWEALTRSCTAHTGYTHQWKTAGAELRSLCMASADDEKQRQTAAAMGWRTFRVIHPGEPAPIRKVEAVCPASAEAGKKLTCIECLACNGTSSNRRGSIAIHAHGGFAVRANLKRKFSSVRA